jgi:hypothetical protein
MTTPAPTAPTLSISFDKAIYAPGDVVTCTATYVDSNGVLATVNATANATDANTPPNTATALGSFQVGQASELMTVTITDTATDVYAVEGTPVIGTTVLTTTAPSIV